MIDVSEGNQVILEKKGKVSNKTNLNVSILKWLSTNENKTLDAKLVQKNEKPAQSYQSRYNYEESDRTMEESENSRVRKLSSQVELICRRLESLENSFQTIIGKSRVIKYRKNRRVVYIPKTGIYESVLKHLRENENEELKITIEKVFQKAAQQLGIIK